MARRKELVSPVVQAGHTLLLAPEASVTLYGFPISLHGWAKELFRSDLRKCSPFRKLGGRSNPLDAILLLTLYSLNM